MTVRIGKNYGSVFKMGQKSKIKNKKGCGNSVLGFSQILLWITQWCACLWMVTVTRLGRLLDPVQTTETLNLKTKRNSRKTHGAKSAKKNTQPSLHRTGPDIVLTVQGIQSGSTGYDTRFSNNCAWATFGGSTYETFCQCYCICNIYSPHCQ